MTSQHAKGLAWIAVAIVVGASLAFGLGRLARLVPWPVESLLAGAVGPDWTRHACTDHASPEAAAALHKLLDRLYPRYADDRAFPLDVVVVPGDVVNAFAYLGGRIVVFDGILQKIESPEELAGILSHEIEHVRRRHVMQAFLARSLTGSGLRRIFSTDGGADAASMLLALRFTREQEGEADRGGLERLRNARVDARGFQKFFERAAQSSAFAEMMSDHPANAERAALVASYTGYATEPVLSAGEWAALKRICE